MWVTTTQASVARSTSPSSKSVWRKGRSTSQCQARRVRGWPSSTAFTSFPGAESATKCCMDCRVACGKSDCIPAPGATPTPRRGSRKAPAG
eukprot:2119544-Prorocentrum_lima.AAC.1